MAGPQINHVLPRSTAKVAAALTFVVACMFAAPCAAVWCMFCGQYWGPPGISAMDTPLRPYSIPRCPAWGGHCFRYRVAGECHGGPWEGPCGFSPSGEFEGAVTVNGEMAESFAPYGFERVGQIPNDGLFQGSAPPAR